MLLNCIFAVRYPRQKFVRKIETGNVVKFCKNTPIKYADRKRHGMENISIIYCKSGDSVRPYCGAEICARKITFFGIVFGTMSTLNSGTFFPSRT